MDRGRHGAASGHHRYRKRHAGGLLDIFASNCSAYFSKLAVVPYKRAKRARYGTHNHRKSFCEGWSSGPSSNNTLWLWVPAFAGTTVEYVAAHAPTGRHARETLLNSLSITDQNSRMIASVVIVPTSQFDQNTPRLPPDPIIERRNASSARLPSTSASVNGAKGMPIFLKT